MCLCLLRYRFYVQEYTPGFHVISVPRQGWGIAAAGGHAEYDVPKCAPGTPRENCTHTIWGILTPGGDNLHLAAIHFHCHAPTCLAMEIYNNQTGELVCRQEPVYGGSGKIDLAKFDEPGYILQPPCLWGYEPGLAPMPLASGVPFLIKAITSRIHVLFRLSFTLADIVMRCFFLSCRLTPFPLCFSLSRCHIWTSWRDGLSGGDIGALE